MFIILDYSSALEYSIIRRYTNIVYYYYYYYDQHAQVNCLYELSLAKTYHIIIDGFNPHEINDTINAIATG